MGFEHEPYKPKSPAEKLADYFIDRTGEWMHGLQVANETGISPGIMYPILRVMTEPDGLLVELPDEDTGRTYYSHQPPSGNAEGEHIMAPSSTV